MIEPLKSFPFNFIMPGEFSTTDAAQASKWIVA